MSKSFICIVVVLNLFGCSQVIKKNDVFEPPKTILAIEIGAKGVKGRLFNSSLNSRGEHDIQEQSYQKNINTNITDENTENVEMFSNNKILETASAVSEIVKLFKKENHISDDNIYIFGSSALLKYKNKELLSFEVNKIINKHVEFIDVKDEVVYGYIDSIPSDYKNTALIVDIGSGNTKMGYSDQIAKTNDYIDISMGTKTFFDKIISKRHSYMVTIDDLADIDGFVNKIINNKSQNKLIEEVGNNLSPETHNFIFNMKSNNNRNKLIQSLVIDLNRIILTNKEFADKYLKTLAYKENTDDFFRINRLLLDNNFPIKTYPVIKQVDVNNLEILRKYFISDPIKDKLKYNKTLRTRDPVYIVGGAVWAFTALMYPQHSDDDMVEIRYSDIVDFSKMTIDQIDKFSSLNNFVGKNIGLGAPKVLRDVRQVFKPEELASGALILKSIFEELNLIDKKAYFVRNGSWLKGAIAYKLDKSTFLHGEKSGFSDQNVMASDTDEGVFEKDGKIYIKVKNRSFVSVIDELAYKLRFNYTILSDYTNQAISLYENSEKNTEAAYVSENWNKIKAVTYNSIYEMLVSITKDSDNNLAPLVSLEYKKVSDGFVFGKSENNSYKNSYKKIFLNSMTAKDADEAVKKMYFGKETQFIVDNNKSKTITISSQVKAGQSLNQTSNQDLSVLQSSTYQVHDKPSIENAAVVSIPAQNAIIVKADPELISIIGDIISSLDAKYPQVLVETTVFEVDDSIAKKIGAAIDYSKSNGGSAFHIATPFQEGLSISSLPAMFYQYSDAEKKLSLLTNLVLNDRDGLVKVLAEPRIVMKPGEEAAIALNTVKYVAIQGVNAADLKEVETGITFRITPVLLSENKISMKLSIEQSEFIPTSENNITLSTNKNTINTTIIANDGELVSIGGINTKRYAGASSGIPILKDIPFIGVLFSSRTKDTTNTKIEFMIKPVIKNMSIYQKQKLTHIEEGKQGFDNSTNIFY